MESMEGLQEQQDKILTFVDFVFSWDCRLRAELNAVLESSKTKDAPAKKISLNDFVIKVSISLLHLDFYSFIIWVSSFFFFWAFLSFSSQ
jgi:hypothetical protein